jgi:hypothetical protein
VAAARQDWLINQKKIITLQEQWVEKNKSNDSHFCCWPLRKAFRLWWRTFDLTYCTRMLYHHLDSSGHVPFTNVERSGVCIRIEWLWPVICSASATSITSDILMTDCGTVSGCKKKERLHFWNKKWLIFVLHIWLLSNWNFINILSLPPRWCLTTFFFFLSRELMFLSRNALGYFLQKVLNTYLVIHKLGHKFKKYFFLIFF